MNSVYGITEDDIKLRLEENVKIMFRKPISSASNLQAYQALAVAVKDIIADKWIATHSHYFCQDAKIVYYLSMEFLMGRFLGNAVHNLAIYDIIEKVINDLGFDYNLIEDAERDPGLGNGGLGRLAACFLDSMSTLDYPAYGCGIRYHHGIFEQKIENGYQVEFPDNWLVNGDMWGVRREEYALEVKFGGNVAPMAQANGDYKFELENYQSVIAVPYDYPIPGYKTNTVNTLRLWDAEAKNAFDLASFNKGDYSQAMSEQVLARTVAEVLYPADEFMAGKELRLKQQYFFISATLQRVLNRFSGMHDDFNMLPDKVQFQLNDTHPTVAIAELMRLLVDEYGLPWNSAWDITLKTCAYTNHTIMSEALEKWPIELFSRLLPRVYMIVDEINRRFCAFLIERFGDDPGKIRRMALIADGQVRMAHLAIVGSHSVNGVAKIHTEILKNYELADFYNIYPEKFNNKTNGITQRRWLLHCNPGLAGLITDAIGDGWITDLQQLENIAPFADDAAFREAFARVKADNKAKLAEYINARTGISVDPESIFDIQVKRLHEYKRQALNALHILDMYCRLKTNPGLHIVPRTFIFGAKASSSYARAKLIIKLITSVAELVNNDKTIDGRIKVVFMENYRVSLAEKLIPAADVSEQISTAGKEASGTGNMKFMLNGALTIGTLDGANVEILEEVGCENIFIFGLTADEAQKLRAERSYAPWDVYNLDHRIQRVMTSLIDGSLSPTQPDLFRELYDALLNGYGGAPADEYFVLKDFASYAAAHLRVNDAFLEKDRWNKSAIMNVAKSGEFSSDRTIGQYAEDIWKLDRTPIKM
ncbi:MAG: glycogen/starch/alpha-glucan phosphorylase [Clostridiales bacterium]|jgi:starch phosphorylase|nr:glycogen/starch/alpha-glucan phosphorylase [Clostridiales bacterium]